MILPEKPPIEDILLHYGKNHRESDPGSGRYRYGSGKEPYQHAKDFLTRVEQLRAKNEPYTDATGKYGPAGRTYTGDTAVAHQMGLSSTEWRLNYTAAKNEAETELYNKIIALKDQGYGPTAIARELGLKNESTVRSKIKAETVYNRELARNTADFLKEIIEERGIIDIGPGQENYLGIPRKKLDDAIFLLEQEGYITSGGGYKNPTDLAGNHNINLNVIGPKDMLKKDVFDPDKINFMTMEDYNKFRQENDISTLEDYVSKDGGETFHKAFEYPASLDSSRVMIRYKEDGGIDKDGIIEIRRGVDDLDLKGSTYAQVRILVDNDHYLKGMALYSNEKMPDGIDIIFNTNKTKDVPKMEVLKKCQKDADGNVDKDNPFGSSIKELKDGGQYYYTDANGNEKLGLINKTRAEGDWSEWKDKVPAQFLSKQTLQLAERQLNLAIADKKAEFNDILELDNPTLRKKMLETFASDCDSASVHLQAAALPRQKHQVILPLTSMNEKECYAPGYRDGEKVALIRYPHGGTFEIPILTVNNDHPEAKRLFSDGKGDDCVAINKNVADRLSGADFDGDTVMVIPLSSKVNIKSTPYLKELVGFDPKVEYATLPAKNKKGEDIRVNAAGVKVNIMSEDHKQKQMGIVSNLISDMNIKGANEEELAKAVKHSMVVIDAVKHNLDYKRSEKENDIKALKQKYQGHYEDGVYKEGASTLISRAKNDESVPKRQGQPRVNKIGNYDYDPTKPEGALIFKKSDQLYSVKVKVNYDVVDPKTGKVKTKSEWVYANDSTPKSNKEAAKNNDIEKVQKKIKDGYFYYNKEVDGKRVKVKVTNEPIKISERMQRSTQMAETDDARTLISDRNTKMENLYANYANAMKALANEARKIAVYTKGVNYSPNAAKVYAKEVDELNRAIDISEKNAPRERQAIVISTSRVNAKKESNPDMTKKELKKLSQRELTRARGEVGARRQTIKITERQWEAIQAGALRKSTLETIFDKADLDILREYATPKGSKVLSDSKKARIKAMKASGYTNAEIGEALGISASSVSKYANS